MMEGDERSGGEIVTAASHESVTTRSSDGESTDKYADNVATKNTTECNDCSDSVDMDIIIGDAKADKEIQARRKEYKYLTERAFADHEERLIIEGRVPKIMLATPLDDEPMKLWDKNTVLARNGQEIHKLTIAKQMNDGMDITQLSQDRVKKYQMIGKYQITGKKGASTCVPDSQIMNDNDSSLLKEDDYGVMIILSVDY